MSKSRTIASHGRGGAGNIGPTIFDDDKANLITPTIKSDTYTTGRGGSGNMKKNDLDHPEEARRSQDVNPAIQQDSKGPTHTGRGEYMNCPPLCILVANVSLMIP